MDLQKLTSSSFDLMLNEIEEKESETIRNLWTVGSSLEIYSKSEQKWVNGEIIKIFIDKEGEWITVQYLNNKIKEIQRYNKHIRPINSTPSQKHNMNEPEIPKTNDEHYADTDDECGVDWDEILKEIGQENIRFIKNLITSNTIDINEKHPINGKTLLIYSVIIGSYDLVKLICDFGGDVNIADNDGLDAFNYAAKYGKFRITELLCYRQLVGALGNDLQDIASKLYQKNRESKLIKAFKTKDAWGSSDDEQQLYEMITKFMIKTIKDRAVFGSDMLFYAWYFVINNEKETPLQSELFKTMMETYSEILRDTKDKDGWSWLKQYFLPSLIWVLPHPNCNINQTATNIEDIDIDDGDDVEIILQNTMFYELLVRVRQESKRQSDLLLRDKIAKIKQEKINDWKELIEYNVITPSNARQDTVGCLQPKYTENDLDQYPGSTHFNAKKHYDKCIYLNELLFTANVLDSMFQKDVRKIAQQIYTESGGDIVAIYRAGPIKTLARSQSKVDNEYVLEAFPCSAKILDINRCALQFKTIRKMMSFLKKFSTKVKMKKARSIKQIIRVKNGWSVYNFKQPQYTDIKLNVLIQSPYDKNQMIVAEMQFLLDIMSAFKKVSHKIYSIERKYELIYNYNKMVSQVQSFKDNMDLNAVLIDLVQNDDIKYFKLLWTTIQPNMDTLVDYKTFTRNVWTHSVIHIMYQNGKINTYLKNEYLDLYEKTIYKFIKMYATKYGFASSDDSLQNLDGFLHSISSKHNPTYSKDEMFANFLKQLLSLYSLKNNSNKLKKLLKMEGEGSWWSGTTILDVICTSENRYTKSLSTILNTSLLSDKEILLMLRRPFDKALKNRYFDIAMYLINHVKNDKSAFFNLFDPDRIRSLLMRTCESKDRLSTKALRLILHNPLISDKKRHEIFTGDDYVLSSAVKGFYGNVQFILHHFRNNKQQIMKWLTTEDGDILNITEGDGLNTASDECILSILKYFKNDRANLLKLICRKYNNYGEEGRVFDQICKENKIKSLRFILYECPAISYKDILQLLCNKKYLRDRSPIFGPPRGKIAGIRETGLEIIKYFRHDRLLFYRLLSCMITEEFNVFMAIFSSKRRVSSEIGKRNIKALHYILVDSALNEYDKYQLLSYKNREDKTSLYQLFYCTNDDIILNMLFDQNMFNPKLLVKLLCQQTEKEKMCVMECSGEDIERVLEVVDDQTFLSEWFPGKDNFRYVDAEIFEKYEQYLTLKDSVTFENQAKTVEAQQNCKTLFELACYFGKCEMVKKILINYIQNDSETLLKWMDTDLIKSILARSNKHDTTLSILLKNVLIAKQDAIDLLTNPNDIDGGSLLFKAKIPRLMEIMNHYKNDSNLLYTFLHAKSDDTHLWEVDSDYSEVKALDMNYKIQVFDYIAELNDNNKKGILQFLQYMNKKDVMKLLHHRFVVKADDLSNDDEHVFYSEISFRNSCIYGVGSVVIKWAKNDRKVLKTLLTLQNNEKNAICGSLTALMLICKGNFEDLNMDNTKFEDSETLNLVLNDSALTHEDKVDIISHTDANDQNVLHYACRYGDNSQNACEIIQYFQKMNDQETLEKLLLMKNKSAGDSCLILAVKYGKLKLIKCVINAITDDNIMSKILSLQNNECKTAFDISKDMSTKKNVWKEDDEYMYDYKYDIEELIESCLEYLKFATLLSSSEINRNIDITEFSEYVTNPFISCCRFGKRQTVMNLLNYVKRIDNDKNEKFRRLLLDNYTVLSRDNGLMIALEHGYNEIILEIFNAVPNLKLKIELLSSTNFAGETILSLLCKNDYNLDIILKLLENMNCDKKTIYSVLNKTNSRNKTCFDYSDNITKYIKQYLK